MVVNNKVAHKHAEVIKAWADGAVIQHYDSLAGWIDAYKPAWKIDQLYRIKPEVVKPKWPETTLSDDSLMYAYRSSVHGLRDVANSAIYHALEAGQVVLPNSIADTFERDMRLASAVWDAAIKAVATHPEFYYSLNFPKMLENTVSTVK